MSALLQLDLRPHQGQRTFVKLPVACKNEYLSHERSSPDSVGAEKPRGSSFLSRTNSDGLSAVCSTLRSDVSRFLPED